MPFDNTFCNHQTEASTGSRAAISPSEAIEHVTEIVGRNPRPRILDRKLNFTIGPADTHHDSAVTRREFIGVTQYVRQDLRETVAVRNRVTRPQTRNWKQA